MHTPHSHWLSAGLVLASATFLAGCDRPWERSFDGTEAFPLGTHSLLPPEMAMDAETKARGGAVEPRRIAVSRFEQPVDEQPLAFNHKIHAGAEADGGMALDCQYCHSNARKSTFAGVPPLETCNGCHKMVDTTDRPVLEELKGYVDRGEAIPWVKVHDAPDFVHFDHSAHVADAGVECQECHGPIETLGVAERDVEMTMEMGWCLDCHKNHPSVDENYGANAELRRAELKDCWTCHK